MIRSILVALDDTPGAAAARDAAIALARRTGAALTAAVVLDRPHAADEHEAVPLGAAAFKERRDARRLARAAAEADAALAACAEAAAGQPFEALRLDDAPEPALLRAGATHDLTVIGRDSTLGQEETDNGLAPVVEALLRDGARPLLVVPPGAAPLAAGEDDRRPVLVAYDGSLPAMRAVQGFALLRLVEGAPAHVVCIDEDGAEARRLAAEAGAFLRRHGVAVTEAPMAEGRPADRLPAAAASLSARALVMGAFGTTGLRGLFLGTSTRRLLREARCPIFVQH
jgi:nucleotide-binding universal stress UspA family protein